MADFSKTNRCCMCPKAFCCSTCRCKHEDAVHNMKHSSRLCSCFVKPLNLKIVKKIEAIPLNHLSLAKENSAMPKIEEIQIVEDESCVEKTDNVKQLIAKYNQATNMTPFNSTDKDKKRVSFDRQTYQIGEQKYKMQIGVTSTPHQSNCEICATSTPHQSNCEKGSIDFIKMTSTPLEDCDDPEGTRDSGFEMIKPVEQPSFADCASLDEENCVNGEMNIIMNSTSSPYESQKTSPTKEASQKLELAEENGIAGKTNYFTLSSPNDPNTTSLEERGIVATENPDANAAIETTLWQSACSFSDNEEECELKEEVSWIIESSIRVNPSTCSEAEASSQPSEENEETNSVNDATDDEFSDSSCSTANISQRVWTKITNSIISALNSTKDLCSFNSNISKRSLDMCDDSEPSPKRRKYEPLVKCRPPIHEMGTVAFLNGRLVLGVDKATQTEDHYFT